MWWVQRYQALLCIMNILLYSDATNVSTCVFYSRFVNLDLYQTWCLFTYTDTLIEPEWNIIDFVLNISFPSPECYQLISKDYWQRWEQDICYFCTIPWISSFAMWERWNVVWLWRWWFSTDRRTRTNDPFKTLFRQHGDICHLPVTLRKLEWILWPSWSSQQIKYRILSKESSLIKSPGEDRRHTVIDNTEPAMDSWVSVTYVGHHEPSMCQSDKKAATKS